VVSGLSSRDTSPAIALTRRAILSERRSAQLGAAGDAAVGVQGPLAADRAAGDAGGAELAKGADDDVLQ